VPLIVEYDAFWTRYFYRLHKLEQKHQQFLQLAQRAQQPEEEVGPGLVAAVLLQLVLIEGLVAGHSCARCLPSCRLLSLCLLVRIVYVQHITLCRTRLLVQLGWGSDDDEEDKRTPASPAAAVVAVSSVADDADDAAGAPEEQKPDEDVDRLEPLKGESTGACS
jgi:hypothetical protein